MATVTVDTIQEHLNRPLLPHELVRATLDIAAIYECIENWLNFKLVNTVITDERHYGVSEVESMRFNWKPVKSVQGVRFGTVDADLYTTYNDDWQYQIIPRETVYFVSYTTDASAALKYASTIERIVVNATIHPLLMPDVIRYNVISSYTVEGTSISYNNAGGGTPDNAAIGPIPGTDLTSIGRLRRRVIV